MDSSTTRRDFVAASAALAGGGWLALQLPLISMIARAAHASARERAPFKVFTAAEGRTMEAFAEQIIPADPASPGATDAGAVYFADHALESFFAGWLPPVRAGLADLDRRARSRQREITSFADLSPDDQRRIMRQVEGTPFFDLSRQLSVMGVIADPVYGGNQDGAREKVLRIEHRPAFRPPFGYYDAEYARGRGGSGR
jgi:gluconate 2-dehydrogenase gamma chain